MSTFKIDFLIAGVQKGGTTALDHYLRRHPGIEMGKIKELHFFDNEEIFSKSKVDYSVLESQFTRIPDKIYGESTPIYIYWEPCMKRIWNYNKNMKIVAILRNPIERAFSQWNMEFQLNRENECFFDSIKSENERARETLPLQHRVYSYVDRGFYSEQIRRVNRFFPDKQILFIKYEDYVKHQELTLYKVFEFLGLKHSDYSFEHTLVHNRRQEAEISEYEKQYLKQIYYNDIKEVERILNWDCSDWLI